jgi:tripartite-type tricarboxylate transporter receptor subunit TctC
VKSVPELIAFAKANPGKVNFGTSSSKNVPHLAGEMLANMAGVKLVHVPYKSNAQAAAETLAGLTQIYIDGIPPMSVHMQAGRLRVIAVSSARRLSNFPEIPAVAETLPGFEFVGWFAILAPAGTPAQVVARVNTDVNAVVKLPEVANRLLGFGIYEPGGTPEQLAKFLRAERDNYARAVKAAGIEPE